MKKAKSNKTTSEENGNKRYRIVFFGILLFVLVIFVVLTFITRDTLFLKYFHKDQLPYAILSVSFISLPILKLVSSSLKKYSLKKVAIGASGIISVVYFLFYSIISSLHEDDNSTTSHNSKNNNSQEYAKYIAGAFYVCSDIIVGIMLQIFWESVSSSFLLSDKKMSVNSINYGSTFASLFIGFGFIKKLNEWKITTIQNLIILSGFAMFLTIGYLISPSPVGSKKNKNTPNNSNNNNSSNDSNAEQNSSNKKNASAMKIILSKPYYIHMCVFEVAATIGRVLCDIQMLAILSKLPEAEMKNKLGSINGFQSLLMIPLQASTSYINRQFGVLYGLAFMPISMILFGFFTAATPSIFMLVSTRAIYNAVTYTIFGTSRELLWLPLSIEDRLKAKPIITGSFRSVARAGAAFLSMFLKYIQKYQSEIAKNNPVLMDSEEQQHSSNNSDAKIIGICIVILAIGFLVEVIRARVAYAKEFYNMIGTLDGTISSTTDNIRADVHHLNMADPVSKRIIKETLLNGKISQRIFILDSLPPNVVVDFSRELRALIWTELNHVREKKNLQYKNSQKRMSTIAGSSSSSGSNLNKSKTDDDAPHDIPLIRLQSPARATSTPNKNRRNSTSMSPRMSSTKKSIKRRSRQKIAGSVGSSDALNTSFDDGLPMLSVDTNFSSPSSSSIKKNNLDNGGGRGRPVWTNSSNGRSNGNTSDIPDTAIRLKALEVAGRAGLLTVDDLLMIICDTALAREMRIAAIHICGDNEKLNAASSTALIRALERFVKYPSNPRTLRVSAAICLLKLTDWIHESSHIFLYSMLHNRASDEKSQVAALSLIGMHLSEMISDGYLIFILNSENTRNNVHLLTAALKNCNGRRSKILIPSLVKKLAVSAVVDLVCEALLHFDVKDTIEVIEKILKKELETLQKRLEQKDTKKKHFKSENFFIGISRYLGYIYELNDVKATLKITQLVLNALEELLHMGAVSKTFAELLHDHVNVELKKHLQKDLSDLINKTLKHVDKNLSEFFTMVSGENNPFSTKMLDSNILTRDEVHFLLQIVAVSHFPMGLSVDLLLEAASSQNEQVRVATFEVLENLLQGTLKDKVKAILLKLLESETILENKLQGKLQESIKRISLRLCNKGNANEINSQNDDDEMLAKVQTLENSELFEGLRLRELKDVSNVVTFKFVKKGDILIEEEVLCIVVSGKFSIKEGDDSIIAEEGHSIGDPPLRAFFSNYTSPTATPTNLNISQFERMAAASKVSAEAMEDSLVIKITHISLQQLLKVNSRVLNGILRTLLINMRDCTLLRNSRVNGTNKKAQSVAEEDSALHGILKRHVRNAKTQEGSNGFSGKNSYINNSSNLQKCIKLSRSRIFATLDHKYIEALAFIAVERVYAPGDIIFHEGDSAETLFIAEDACISFNANTSYHSNDNRNAQRQLYGEIALLPQATRLNSLYAAKNSPNGKVTVLEFSARSLLSLTKRHRSICQALCLSVSDRLENELYLLRVGDTASVTKGYKENIDEEERLISVMETLDEEDDAFTNSFNQSEDNLRRSVSGDNLGRETSASLSVSGQWGRMRASIHAVNGLRRRKRKGVHLM